MKAKMLLTGVSSGLCATLDADPGALSNALRVKNPLSDAWTAIICRETPWHLADLADLVDTKVKPVAANAKPYMADHTDPVVASQSNMLFSRVARFANSTVLAAKATGDFEAFGATVVGFAASMTEVAAAKTYHEELGGECAAWAWAHVKPKVVRVRRPKPEFTTDQRIAKAMAELRLEGVKPSNQKVAWHTGLALNTVSIHRRNTSTKLAHSPMLEGKPCGTISHTLPVDEVGTTPIATTTVFPPRHFGLATSTHTPKEISTMTAKT